MGQQPSEVTVRFYHPANKTQTGWSPLYGTTNSTGYFTVLDVTPGLYDIKVKNCTDLTEVRRGINLTAGGPPYYQEFGASREGDAFEDNMITVKDLNRVNVAYGTTPSSPSGWDPRCDFNRDQMITIKDVNTVNVNYGKSGTPYP